jgi:ribosomal protein L40E
MGEFADDAMDMCMDLAFETEDWGYIPHFRSHNPYRITCKFCGAKQLRWAQVEGKWRLFEKGGKEQDRLHNCKDHYTTLRRKKHEEVR